MRKKCCISWLLLTLLAPMTLANEVFIIPSLSFSDRQFQYSVGDGGVSGHIPSLGLGITTTYKQFYADISAEKNTSASEESTTNLLFTQTVEFDRTDIVASLGYAVNESVSTFIGYKYGKSMITALTPSPFAGAKISLSGQGIFIGAGGGWSVKEWGFISFSAAFAKMRSNYEDLIVHEEEGSASGTSLVIKWKARVPYTQRLYYDFSLIRHDYDYQDLERFGRDISEQILSLRAALSYRF